MAPTKAEAFARSMTEQLSKQPSVMSEDALLDMLGGKKELTETPTTTTTNNNSKVYIYIYICKPN